MANKTIELYSYEDNSQETEVSIKSYVTNEEIKINQMDISYVKLLLKHGIFIIDGYIREKEKSLESILKLNKWGLVKGNEKDWLRKVNIKIVRNGYVVREYVFNGYLGDYVEYYDNSKKRFNFVIRQYKLVNLDNSYGKSESDKIDAYVKNMEIKQVKGQGIIKPLDSHVDIPSILLSASNLTTAISLAQNVITGSTPITLTFIFIAHGTGMVTEFLADVYFVIKGEPEKMGSFNMTRDWFYKPIGEILVNGINNTYPIINLNNQIGEDIYNMGNLAFSSVDLGGKLLNGFKAFKTSKGEGILYTIRLKEVKVSHFGRQLQPQKYVGLTPIKATGKFVQDMGLDVYSTKKSFENEIKKREEEKYPTVKNIIMPKNTDIR